MDVRLTAQDSSTDRSVDLVLIAEPNTPLRIVENHLRRVLGTPGPAPQSVTVPSSPAPYPPPAAPSPRGGVPGWEQTFGPRKPAPPGGFPPPGYGAQQPGYGGAPPQYPPQQNPYGGSPGYGQPSYGHPGQYGQQYPGQYAPQYPGQYAPQYPGQQQYGGAPQYGGLWVNGRPLDPEQPLAGSPIRDGAIVSVGGPGDGALADYDIGGTHEVRIVSGPDAGRVHRVGLGELYLGSDPEVGVWIDDPSVAPVQAKVTISPQGISWEHLGGPVPAGVEGRDLRMSGPVGLDE